MIEIDTRHRTIKLTTEDKYNEYDADFVKVEMCEVGNICDGNAPCVRISVEKMDGGAYFMSESALVNLKDFHYLIQALNREWDRMRKDLEID